jgi:hypothetical protein
MRRLLAAVSEEVDMAVITPGAREQLLPVVACSAEHGKAS